MNYEEFAFLNQQLASMLKTGIPLEGALRQICSGMRQGKLRAELELLEKDLAKGIPLNEALSKRSLPHLYVQLVKTGSEANNLPDILTLLADYYHRTHHLWTRLKGLMVYPAIVLAAAFGVSLLISVAFRQVNAIGNESRLWESESNPTLPLACAIGTTVPAVVLGGLLLAVFGVLFVPALRKRASWGLPGFKEAHIARLASSLSLMLRSGCTLQHSLKLCGQLESHKGIAGDLVRWEALLGEGRGKLKDLAPGSQTLPPLFFWILSVDGEDLGGGLARAADTYHARAIFKTDMLLNAALPVSILLLGSTIGLQMFSLAALMTRMFSTLGN